MAVGRAVALLGPLEPRPGEGGTLFLSADTYTSVLVEGMKMECGEIDEPNPSAEHSSLKAGRRIEPLAVRCLRRSTAYAAALSVILAGCVSDGVVPSPSSTAQNLIRNGGFEQHGAIEWCEFRRDGSRAATRRRARIVSS